MPCEYYDFYKNNFEFDNPYVLHKYIWISYLLIIYFKFIYEHKEIHHSNMDLTLLLLNTKGKYNKIY